MAPHLTKKRRMREGWSVKRKRGIEGPVVDLTD